MFRELQMLRYKTLHSKFFAASLLDKLHPWLHPHDYWISEDHSYTNPLVHRMCLVIWYKDFISPKFRTLYMVD